MSEAATLVPSLSHWVSAEERAPRLRLPSGPVPPTQSAQANWPDSRPGQVLQFEVSSLSADAAQTTLPLLDVQPVAPRPAVWLIGQGLLHRGQTGGGGFLGLSATMARMALSNSTRQELVHVAAGDAYPLYRAR